MQTTTYLALISALALLSLATTTIAQDEPTGAPRPPAVAEDTPPPPPADEADPQPTKPPAGRTSPRSAETQPTAKPHVALEIQGDREDWGLIIIELYPDKAPRTVENFLRYVDEGFYNGTIFHRVIPGFLIQGGGYTTVSAKKTSGLHKPIPNEAEQSGLKNLRGTIAMARGREPDSATSQFFINLDTTPGLDPGHPMGDGAGYCVFGKVIAGMDIVEQIADVRTRRSVRLTADLTPSQPVRPPTIKHAFQVAPEDIAELTEPASPAKPTPPAPAERRAEDDAPPKPTPAKQPAGEDPEFDPNPPE